MYRSAQRHPDARPYYGVGIEFPRECDGDAAQAEALHGLDLVEIIPEGFFQGRRAGLLRSLAVSGKPVVVHSIDMSLGTDEPLRRAHFAAIRPIIDAVNCVFFSDHICMTRAAGIEIGQLTTLPWSVEVADVFCRHIDELREQVGDLPLMFENITNRFVVPSSTLSETDFLNLITRRSGAGLLLDITNTYTNSVNHGFDAKAWLDAIDTSTITGVHLAGGIWEDGTLYDSHSRAVPPEVWELYEYVLGTAAPQAIIVEWDQDTPPLARLLREAKTARRLRQRVLTRNESRVALPGRLREHRGHLAEASPVWEQTR